MNTSFCDIINLKIINRSIVELEDNKYKFNNNLFSLNDDFLVDYDLYFYEDFNGIYNDFNKVMYFLIPPNYVSSNLQYNEDISSSGFNQFYLIAADISSYDDFYSYTEENNSNPSGNEDEEEVEPLPDDFEPPEVYGSSEGGTTPNSGGGEEEQEEVYDLVIDDLEMPGIAKAGAQIDYNETILHNNTRHISQFCKLSKLYIIKVYPNNYIEFKNTSFPLSNLEFNIPSNGIIPLIPCVVLDGFWDNNQSLDGLWLALPETYQKSSRAFENNKPAQMILDSSNSGVFNLNSDIITSYLNKGENNITITHQMQSINKNNFLTAWSNESDDIENNIALEYSISGANKTTLIIEPDDTKKCFYYQLKENNTVIWSSNLCQLNLSTSNDIIEILPVRYYDTKDLDDNYVRIYDNKGSYIALYIRITARKLDKIQLSYGYTYSEAADNNATIFYEKDELNIRDATKQVYIITRENQTGQNKLLKSDSAIYFKLVTSIEQDGGGYIDSTSYYACPAKEKTYPILDVEPYGVAIGQASTGVQGRQLFEVSSNYTTRFYGPVEIFPVGAIYMSMSPENPSKYFYGIWAPWAQGRMPIGVSTAEEDVEFNSAGLIGGEKAHKLTKEEMPSHTHGMNNIWSGGAGSTTAYKPVSNRKRTTKTTTSTGGNQPHNNMPPYITCYMWQRIE